MLSQETTNALNLVAAMIQDFVNTLPVSTRVAVQANAQAAISQIVRDLEQEPSKDALDTSGD